MKNTALGGAFQSFRTKYVMEILNMRVATQKLPATNQTIAVSIGDVLIIISDMDINRMPNTNMVSM